MIEVNEIAYPVGTSAVVTSGDRSVKVVVSSQIDQRRKRCQKIFPTKYHVGNRQFSTYDRALRFAVKSVVQS